MREIKLMRYFKLLFLVLTSIAAVALELEYDVIGFVNDEQVYGELIGNLDDTRVEGFLFNEEGTARYFIGDWIGNGEFEGYDENDEYYKLELATE
ncbi:MAG: hypothetical protein CMK30_06115 [Porticoccaceae bacterium]|nr:hypothetical protein [Porticoccaceae bacterium]|tara:strand:- start:1364 stop:1648 length:285 start_codon:yes stop_codon:yes gene_type:complete